MTTLVNMYNQQMEIWLFESLGWFCRSWSVSGHWPSGNILSSRTCPAPDGSTRNRSNDPVPSETSAQTHALTRPLTYTERRKPSAQSHECVYKLSDRAVRPGRWFPGSSPVTTSCWNPDGSGSKTGCRRGNLGKQQSNDDGKSFFFGLCPHTFDVSEFSRLG